MTLKTRIACLLRAVGRLLSPRLNSLEERVAELERHPFSYSGVWESGEYCCGEFVTHRGGLWHSNTITTSKPGTGSDWQLVVKPGRDGKDISK